MSDLEFYLWCIGFFCLFILGLYAWIFFFVFLIMLGEWLRDRLIPALTPFAREFLCWLFDGVKFLLVQVIWTNLAPTIEKTITEATKLWNMFKGKFV